MHKTLIDEVIHFLMCYITSRKYSDKDIIYLKKQLHKTRLKEKYK